MFVPSKDDEKDNRKKKYVDERLTKRIPIDDDDVCVSVLLYVPSFFLLMVAVCIHGNNMRTRFLSFVGDSKESIGPFCFSFLLANSSMCSTRSTLFCRVRKYVMKTYEWPE